MGFIGFFIAAVFVLFLLARVIGFVVLRNAEPPKKQVVSTLLAWAVVTFIGGLGMGEEGNPKFFQAALAYGIPAVVLALIESGIALAKLERERSGGSPDH